MKRRHSAMAETCITCPVLKGVIVIVDGFIGNDTPGDFSGISGYIYCVPYGASVVVACFEFWFSNLVAVDKLDLQAGSILGHNVHGATPCTVAVMPSHRVRDIFVRACNGAATHRLVGVKIEHVHVEVTTSEHQVGARGNERSPRIPRHVVYIYPISQGD